MRTQSPLRSYLMLSPVSVRSAQSRALMAFTAKWAPIVYPTWSAINPRTGRNGCGCCRVGFVARLRLNRNYVIRKYPLGGEVFPWLAGA